MVIRVFDNRGVAGLAPARVCISRDGEHQFSLPGEYDLTSGELVVRSKGQASVVLPVNALNEPVPLDCLNQPTRDIIKSWFAISMPVERFSQLFATEEVVS